ncbi:hypothetical protein [Neobacillus sp. D3-1R]|uniref:hypothetical protein n=1 Tax=Neobacillus sp. D3-1R TaxID=3445778 RepID=UPI003FA10247
MNNPNQIFIGNIKMNIIGRKCSVSLSQTMQKGKNVVNKKTSGFGETIGDGVVFLKTKTNIEDSDFIDFDSIKNN